jgi:hypothetical protein
MSNKLFCPDHGAYDAALGECPECALEQQGPRAVTSQTEDDLRTELPRKPSQASRIDLDRSGVDATAYSSGRFLDDMTILPRRDEDDEEDFTTVESPEEVPASDLLGLLWVKIGPERGRIYEIKHGVSIGRREGQIRLNDDKVSKRHATLTIEEDQFVIWDLATSNGTYVNGTKIRAATPLKENDQVKIGSTLFVVKVLEP